MHPGSIEDMTDLPDGTEGTAEIAFDVPGWPPTKNEATSLLSAGHSHAARVRALLNAAGQAAARLGWSPLACQIALDLVVRGPNQAPSDATNYLGGVGDVLQVKATGNLDLAHLGALRQVALYLDDRQVRQIRYTEEWAEQPSYTVRIHPLAVGAAPGPAAGQ
ncbi:hypothetical protein EV384_1033 [Micromonospora kangleipakensis]|uniref:Holliday junction resolvase RusA-like endonuclease n=2 Tax=Micromonospora kangleipakensis TaxID=1077942 RepID=A0A4Q8B510_9ACTN|nr:hypothetical protein EV384_1033 [Micromonospora kangleipakensis]